MTKLTKTDIKKIILCGNQIPRKQFRKYFQQQINEFTEAIFKVWKLYDELNCDKMNRESASKLYVYTAIQNILSAFNILVSGYQIPSGNLMRHFHESIAWAILLSSKDLDFYEKFEKDKNSLSYHKGLEYVQRNISKLNIKKKSWDVFKKNMKFYNQFSHSSFFAVSANFSFSQPSKIALGSHFDIEKKENYQKDMRSMINAVYLLENIIFGIKQHMGNSTS